MARKFPTALIVAIMACVLVGLFGALPGYGFSDKEKIMALADEYEALVDKHEKIINEKRNAGDEDGKYAAIKAFQKENNEFIKKFYGLMDNLSEKDKDEVTARMTDIAMRIAGIIQR